MKWIPSIRDSFSVVVSIILSAPVIMIPVGIILLFLPPSRSLEDVSSTSQIVGKTYTTQFPLLYIENLPFDGDVTEHMRSSTLTALTREASSELIDFQASKAQFLDGKSLVTPLRINLVPEGTVFTVVKKLRHHVQHVYSDRAYDYYLLEDSYGNASQVTHRNFNNYLAKPESRHIVSWSDLEKNEGWNPRTIEAIQRDGYTKASYCPNDSWLREEPRQSAYTRISKFVEDFRLENDISWQKYSQKQWRHCVKLTFTSVESYMTMNYYMFGWGLHSKLNTYD